VSSRLKKNRLQVGTGGITPVIPATQEAVILGRRITAEANPGQTVPERLCLEENHHKNGLEGWLKWESTCLASLRP
jgi:hypothetical protein